MEVIKIFFFIALALTVCACSNSNELETGEIQTITLLREAFNKKNNQSVFLDARKLITRKQIDEAGIPILFVELETGQNGTLTPYPGKGVGNTWLGADGATITFENGILKASRGMGDDVMGGISFMPSWKSINKSENYTKTLSYLSGNNKLYTHEFECQIRQNTEKIGITIWDHIFRVKKFEETCLWDGKTIINIFYVDDLNIVRRSRQYHSETLGYILTERLDY